MKIVKKVLKVILIFFAVMIVLMIIMLPFDLNNQKEIKKMTIKEVDLTKLENGQYNGEFSKYRWIYKVKVDVENHTITNIKFTEDSTQPGQYLDDLISKVIEEQKVNIDAIAGATVSSKAALKAIEDALN